MNFTDNLAIAKQIAQLKAQQNSSPFDIDMSLPKNKYGIDFSSLGLNTSSQPQVDQPIDLTTTQDNNGIAKIDFTPHSIPLTNKTIEDASKVDVKSTKVTVDPDQDKPSGFKNFLSKNGSMIGSIADAANKLSDSLFGEKMGSDGPNAGLTQGIDNAYSAASDMVMKVNPMVGGIMKAAGFVGDTINKLGGGTDGLTKVDAVMNTAPMTLLTLGMNGFLGSKTDSITKNEEAFAQVGASYGGTGSAVDDALTKANKKYGLLSGGAKNAVNAQIAEAKRQQNVMSNVADIASDRNAIQISMSAINGNRAAFNMQGGYQQSAIRAGKYGMLIQRANNILEKPIEEYIEAEPIKESEDLFEGFVYQPVKFQKGGSFNIIPEGALHARKHNIDLEGITQKGIPVVSESEDGKIEQQAEIEHSEIIYRISVTEKIEKLKKQFDSDEFTQKEKDQFAIEAGKLITKETLYNTKDNTNLLNNE